RKDPVPVTINGTNEDAGTLTVTSQVGNSAGAILPTTGGVGTTLFYMVGGIMVAVAGVLLITRKRMKAE
ncbi:MAG: LPXTG cell wall anchor domain-containing protein, partial [Ruminococcaceae bacterium]|nr:LPXTG cell wall anchor domain-containing protein [Oscillospiraceae bacterium]